VASTNNVLIKSPVFGRIYTRPVAISTVFNFELKTPGLRVYPNNRVVMRPSENLSAYGGVRGQGGRPKMLARSGFLHVENIFG